MEKEIVINDKKYIVKEVKYKDIISLSQMPKETMARELMKLSIGITDAEFDDLSMKTGVELQKVVNEVNGLGDFH